MKLLSLDPGLSTGWAYFEDSKITGFGILKITKPGFKELYEWLDNLPKFDQIVSESYIIKNYGEGGFDHNFNTGDTLQIIGAIKAHAARTDTPIKEQSRTIKKIGSGWAFGKPYVKKSNQHDTDAIIHGVYYLVKECKVSPGVFRSN